MTAGPSVATFNNSRAESGVVMEGFLISGYTMVLALLGWAALVLLHVVWRASVGPETDPPRPAGPIGWE